MLSEDGFESLAGAEGFHLCFHFAPAEMRGDFRDRHLIEMKQREQRTVVWRQMRKDELRLAKIASRCGWITFAGDVIERIVVFIARRETRERRALMLAEEFEADVRGDALQPMQEGFVRLPLRQCTPGTDKGFLHHVLKIGTVGGEAMEDRGHGGLMAFDEKVEGIQIAGLRRPHVDEIVVRRGGGWRGGAHWVKR